MGEHQNAIREFCTAAKALQDAKDTSKATTKTMRERLKRSKEQLIEALRHMGCNDSCVEARLPTGQTGYVRLVTRKGGLKRLTASSFADALRALVPDDIDGCTPSAITRAAMEKMRGECKEDIVVTKIQPPQMRVARLFATSTTASEYERARQDLREVRSAKKEACTPLMERCERTRDDVLAHLRSHDPGALQQKVRMSRGGAEDCTYILKARPRPARASRGDTVREAERTVTTALGDLPPNALADALAHLQSDRTIAFVSADLRKRLADLRADALNKAPLQVTLARSTSTSS